ncbi:hypothetical protein NQ315_013318 [Exocentrus adspersus]|uniref:Transposase n=1 Tax=Exocentrus adspersus TaxID=1586481 RepID=A0AAV8V7A0_9CUCU|nr:hypothetical protein NQ315_013318 [Exocentrus adspersus]
MLQQILFHPGINQHIFSSLKLAVENMRRKQDRLCILVFDEISLQSSLTYHRKQDEVIGLEDNGTEKRPVLANHANVFMVKGIYRHWKQPIAFTASNGPIKSNELKTLIHSMIEKCQSIGLEVIATVCDQGSANQAAINMLLKDTKEHCLKNNIDNRYFGFLINGHETVPLFDVPHLFKGLRNNLLNKNLHFVIDNQERVAKWVHIEQFYKLDASDPSLRICCKLTDGHVIPSKINKMKVKNCTQVFSHTVGSLMKRIAKWNIEDNYSLPLEAMDTADFILFVDQLFDSLNLSRKSKPQAKPLKWAVTRQSDHKKFWQYSLKMLDTMKFFSLEKQKLVKVPTIKNLIFTVRGFLYLRSQLLTKKNFKYVLTGTFNQDALENFFSYIRSHGVRYTNPNISHFTSSFKSLIVCNFMASHSPRSNCQQDTATECLNNLRSFLTDTVVNDVAPDGNCNIPIDIPREISIPKRVKIARSTIVYMSGAIYRILLKSKILKNCEICKSNLSIRHGAVMDDDFIEARQYERGHLLKPGHYLNFLMNHSLSYLFYLIPRICTYKNISKILQNILQHNLNFKVVNCPQHTLGEKLCEVITRCALYWWTKQINRIANGTDSKFARFLATNPNKEYLDPLKLQAYEKYVACKKSEKHTLRL